MNDAQAILIQPLTAAAFAEFGDVIEAHTPSFSINDGQALRFHDLLHVDTCTADGHTIISIVRSTPSVFPVSLTIVERHPLGSQAFIPQGYYPFLVVVASTTADDTPGKLHAFLSNGRQGINYKRGVWHHPLIALNVSTDFLVVDRAGAGNNCEVVNLSGEIEITAAMLNAVA